MSDPEIIGVWLHRGHKQIAAAFDNSEVLILDGAGQVSAPLIGIIGPEWIELYQEPI